MVVFICARCNDALKKNKVEAHLARCNSPRISCCDCSRDFDDDSYKAHTQCISEDRKYGPQDQQSGVVLDKGQQKQMQWLSKIKDYVRTANLSGPAEMALNKLLEYDNIPRKKPKFLNFINNCVGVRSPKIVEELWNIMEMAHKVDEKSPDNNEEHSSNGNKHNEDNDKLAKRKGDDDAAETKTKKPKIKKEKIKAKVEVEEDNNEPINGSENSENLENKNAIQESNGDTKQTNENTSNNNQAEEPVRIEQIGWFKQLKRQIKSQATMSNKEFKKAIKKIRKEYELPDNQKELISKARLKLQKRKNYVIEDETIKYVRIA